MRGSKNFIIAPFVDFNEFQLLVELVNSSLELVKITTCALIFMFLNFYILQQYNNIYFVYYVAVDVIQFHFLCGTVIFPSVFIFS